MKIKSLVEQYKSGATLRGLGLQIGKRPAFVKSLLEAEGVQIGTSRCSYRLSYHLNDGFFSIIESERQAYWLGVLFADGSVSATNNTIALVSKDSELLESFVKDVSLVGKEIYYNPNHNGAGTIAFCSPKMKECLTGLGCGPRKTKTCAFPSFLPENLKRHFVRGLFDGDGCVTASRGHPQVFFLGTESICMGVRQCLESLGITFNKIQSNPGVKRLRITGKQNVLAVRQYLYRDATTYLKRKREKFYADLHL